MQIHDPSPWNASGEWNDHGISFTNFTWRELDVGMSFGCPGPNSYLGFWEFIDPTANATRSLHGYKRGHMYCHETGSDIFVMGAGCNYSGCGISGDPIQAPVYTDSDQSPAGWTWRLRAVVGEGNYSTGWTAGPYTGDRILIYKR